MSIKFSNAKAIFKVEIKDEITLQLNLMRKSFYCDLLKINIPTNELDISTLDHFKIIQEVKIWEDISKISIDLYKDYKHYSQFVFMSRFDNIEYVNRLKSLGFIYENDKWRSIFKPKNSTVQNNIFMYLLYKSVSEKLRNANLDEKKLDCFRISKPIGENKEDVQIKQKAGQNVPVEFTKERYLHRKCVDDSGIIMPSLGLGSSIKCEFRRTSNTSIDKWSCSICSFKNVWKNIVCDVCFSFQEMQLSNENILSDWLVGNNALWKCISCKCENIVDKYICRKCHTVATFFQKWICEKCKFFNEVLGEFCDACLNENENLRSCEMCNNEKVNIVESNVCSNCETQYIETTNAAISLRGRSYCNNLWCGTINPKDCDHCKNCKLKNRSKIDPFGKMEIHDGLKYLKKWQCTFCGRFNNETTRCIKCRNMRLSSFYKLCSCNWINRKSAANCDKCFKDLE